MRKFAASGGVIELASITYIKEARQRPSDMQRVMEYCMQEKKTLDEEAGIRWVSGVNCDGLNSITEFEATKAAWSKEDGIRFYQYVQSFSPTENITYKQAHEVALAFATKAWPRYEVLVATHCDAGSKLTSNQYCMPVLGLIFFTSTSICGTRQPLDSDVKLKGYVLHSERIAFCYWIIGHIPLFQQLDNSFTDGLIQQHP